MGSETLRMLRCDTCREYFYAAHRGLTAIACCFPSDIDRALELVLPSTPIEEAAHRERLELVQERAENFERALWEQLAQENGRK